MTNDTIQLKIQQRLNKLASGDYDNLECWQIVEAFNKGQVAWCRRNLHGLNVKKAGDEDTKRRIDDLQVLLTKSQILFADKKRYAESVGELPEDYFEWKRIKAPAKSECCDEPRNMTVYLAEEANVELYLSNKLKQPSFSWGETFCTLLGNKIRIYTNDEFVIQKSELIYYRQPRRIEILGCIDPYTTTASPADVECEFKDDLVELFIDEAVKILAGDIESINQQRIASAAVESNN